MINLSHTSFTVEKVSQGLAAQRLKAANEREHWLRKSAWAERYIEQMLANCWGMWDGLFLLSCLVWTLKKIKKKKKTGPKQLRIMIFPPINRPSGQLKIAYRQSYHFWRPTIVCRSMKPDLHRTCSGQVISPPPKVPGCQSVFIGRNFGKHLKSVSLQTILAHVGSNLPNDG